MPFLPDDAQLDEQPQAAPGGGSYLPQGAQLDALPPSYHGSILPFSTDAQGKPYLDWNSGITGQLKSAFTLPGQVASGEVQTPYSSTGQMDPDLMPRTVGLASTMMMDMPGPQLTRTAAPTAQELKATGAAGYDRLNNSGITIKGSEVANLAGDISQNLRQNFFPQQAAPKTHALLDQFATNGDMDFPQFNALWKRMTDTMMEGGSEGAAAKTARDQLEGLWTNLQNSQMTPGSAPTMTGPEAAQAFKDARGNYQGAFKSDELAGGLGRGDTGMLQKAETRAAITNSGQNEGNLIRQRIGTFIGNEDNLAGYSPEEIAALRAVANGTSYQDALRFLGNRSSLMSAIGALFGGGGAESAIGVGAGQGLAKYFKGLEAGIARRGLQGVDEMVRQNTPLGQVYEGTPSPYPRSPPALPARPQLISPPGRERLIAPGLLTPNQNRPIPWWQLEGRA